MVKILSLPERLYDKAPCTMCSKDYTDIACHVLCECPSLYEERNILWNYVTNTLDVRRSVALFSMTDELFTDIILGRQWAGFTSLQTDFVEQFYWSISDIIINHFKKGFINNYKWLNNDL